MSYLSINGIEQSLPIPPESSYQDLIQALRKTLISETSVISSIRVNGLEMNEEEEIKFAQTPLSQLSSVEVFTSHPHSVADETLNDLIEYSHYLENYSQKLADVVGRPEFYPQFTPFIEGLITFTEAIVEVKRVLKADGVPAIDQLELELLTLLKQLLGYQEQGLAPETASLLKDRISPHLSLWRETGIPALSSGRTC